MLPPALLAACFLPLLLVIYICIYTCDQERLGMGVWTVGISVSVPSNSADEKQGREC